MCDKCTEAKKKMPQPSLKMVALLGAMAAIIGMDNMPNFDIANVKSVDEKQPKPSQ